MTAMKGFMELSRQRELVDSFRSWAEKGLYSTIKDSRRRYRMIMEDEAERSARNLSCLPSTKSTSVVDQFVESALQAYHQDMDSLSYTAKGTTSPVNDALCKWLTNIFQYRAQKTFRFFSWHKKGLKALGTDGIHCAFVSWKNETKTKQNQIFTYTDPMGQVQQIAPEMFQMGAAQDPLAYQATINETPVTVTDTFWIHLLDPLTDVVWDMKAPLLDVNMGQFCCVNLSLTIDEIRNYAKQGWFDLLDEEKIETYQETGSFLNTIGSNYDDTKIYGDTDDADLDDLNHIAIWMFFFKENNEWFVQFSHKGEDELSTPKSVNDVFFAGREVNRLPVIIGYADDELWENVGRGLPKLIASLEDEYQDHKNNLNDAAKQALQGKYWKDEGSSVDIDQLINYPVVLGRYGTDFGEIPNNGRTMDVLRNTDSINADMNSLIPTSIMGMGRNVAPKGMDQTLGAVQLAEQDSNQKLGVMLQTYNETFMEPLMWVIAQLIFAYESDETIAKIAAQSIKIPQLPLEPIPGQPPQPPPPPILFQLPMIPTQQGMKVDFSVLDFDIDVQINAGLGAVPNRMKFQNIMQLSQLAQQWNIPFDTGKAFKQVCLLSGFDENQFTMPAPPPPPPPPAEYKLNINADLVQLAQADANFLPFLMQKFYSGMDTQLKADTSVQKVMNQMQQNQNPDRTNQMVNATGPQAQAMSQGGMNGRP